jgi:hypothetical protein
VHGQQIADNFTLTSSGTVGGVQWYGSYFLNGTAPIGSSPKTSLQFDIRFFADNGGLPATNPFYDAQVTATATDTHMTSPGTSDEVYQFSANSIPSVALAGSQQYWISIVNSQSSTRSCGHSPA